PLPARGGAGRGGARWSRRGPGAAGSGSRAGGGADGSHDKVGQLVGQGEVDGLTGDQQAVVKGPVQEVGDRVVVHARAALAAAGGPVAHRGQRKAAGPQRGG